MSNPAELGFLGRQGMAVELIVDLGLPVLQSRAEQEQVAASVQAAAVAVESMAVEEALSAQQVVVVALLM